jgi:hypothetical protein
MVLAKKCGKLLFFNIFCSFYWYNYSEMPIQKKILTLTILLSFMLPFLFGSSNLVEASSLETEKPDPIIVSALSSVYSGMSYVSDSMFGVI